MSLMIQHTHFLVCMLAKTPTIVQIVCMIVSVSSLLSSAVLFWFSSKELYFLTLQFLGSLTNGRH